MKSLKSNVFAVLVVALVLPNSAQSTPLFGQAGVRVTAVDSTTQNFNREPGSALSKSDSPIKLPIQNSTLLNNEVMYYLPKQVLDLTLTFSYWADRKGLPYTGITVSKVPELKIQSIPDPQLRFKADYKHVRGLVTDCKSSELTIADGQLLGGLNGEFEDQTATIASNLGQSAINIAKKIGSMGAAASPDPKEITVKRIVDLDANKALPNTVNGFILGNAPAGFEKGVHFDLNMATALTNINSEYPPRGSIGDQLVKSISLPQYEDKWRQALPKLILWIDKPLISAKSADIIGPGYLRGVVVRSPEVVHMILTADVAKNATNSSGEVEFGKFVPEVTAVALPLQYVLLDLYTELAQTGTFSIIPVRRHMFSDVSTQVKLNGSGSCASLNETSTSPLKTLSEALKNLTGGM